MKTWQEFVRGLRAGLEMFIAGIRSANGDPDAWESSIRAFEAQDRLEPPSAGMIVFVGSSSFTFWDSLERDMAPLPVLNRGFGGARIDDVVRYADRIVIPCRPRAVVLFAGTNDIAWPQPMPAAQVYEGYLALVGRLRSALPGIPVYYIGITPSASRWRYWPIVCEANRLIREFAEADPHLHFIDLTPILLGADGKPDRRLYRIDRLHPNKKGYIQWTAVIKPILQQGEKTGFAKSGEKAAIYS